METKIITKEEFLKMKVSNISQVYEGKRNCCRCGCGGDYTATSFMKNPRSDVDDQKVQEFLTKGQTLANKKGVIESTNSYDTHIMYGSNFIDVRTGKNKTLTFYTDELKKEIE